MLAMITREMIEDFARRIATHFSPEKIILFGSHARSQAYAGSDVDLMVIMDHDTINVEKAIEIENTLDPRFALDLFVRKPSDVKKRVALNDLFIREIVESGITLYERAHS